ncbi:hypothetical protein FACS18947_5770 [Bacteroidia bacterium]|nr:hypothetical protein FACS18947_5770 [Bacteroidia bacterium]
MQTNKKLLLLLLLPILFSCTNNREKKQNQTDIIDDYNQLVKQKIEQLEKENNGLSIVNQNIYWGNDTLNLVSFDKFTNEKKLYFYFSQNTCSPCIEESIHLIEKFIPDYLENENVVFLSPDYIPRFRNNCYGKRLLGLKNGSLEIPLEEENIPFFFMLKENLQIEDLHIVNKNDFEKTAEYLKKISSNRDLK